MTEETGRLGKRHRIKTWRKGKRRSTPLPGHISKKQSKKGLYTQFPKIKLEQDLWRYVKQLKTVVELF